MPLNAGPTPLYGYTWRDGTTGSRHTHDAYEIDPDVADTIVWIFEQVLQGVSLLQIAHQLNENGVLTPAYYLASKWGVGRVRKGLGIWTYHMVRHIVDNPAYMGKQRAFAFAVKEEIQVNDITGKRKTVVSHTRRPDEETVVLPDTTCPAIIDERRWAKAQVMVQKRPDSIRRRRDREATLISGGHVYCGYCHRPATTISWQVKAARARRYGYSCRRSASRCPNPSLRCSRPVTLETHSIDQQVWDTVCGHIRQEIAGENPVEARKTSARAQLSAIQSTLESTKSQLKRKTAELKKLERAMREAMKCEYDETRVGRIGMLLNSCYGEIRKLKETQHECAKGIGALQKELAAIQFATDMVKKLGENVDNADWVTKRRLLYFFGVKVFIYHTGTDVDSQGHRWHIEYGWDGLEEDLNPPPWTLNYHDDAPFTCTP